MKKNIRTLPLILILSLTILLFTLDMEVYAAKKPKLNKKKVSLVVGKTYKLKVKNSNQLKLSSMMTSTTAVLSVPAIRNMSWPILELNGNMIAFLITTMLKYILVEKKLVTHSATHTTHLLPYTTKYIIQRFLIAFGFFTFQK